MNLRHALAIGLLVPFLALGIAEVGRFVLNHQQSIEFDSCISGEWFQQDGTRYQCIEGMWFIMPGDNPIPMDATDTTIMPSRKPKGNK